MFLQIQSTIIFNKELKRRTATVKLGFCSLVPFSKALRKLYFSHHLPSPANILTKHLTNEQCVCTKEEVGHIKHPGLHFSGGQMKDRYTKSTILAVHTFAKQNISLTYSSLLDPHLHSLNTRKKKKFKPQARLWNHKSVNKYSRMTSHTPNHNLRRCIMFSIWINTCLHMAGFSHFHSTV